MRTFSSKCGATLLCAVVSGLAHCNSIYAQDAALANRPQVVTGASTNGYELEIATTNGTFAVGERIELRMTLRNVTSNALPIKVQDGLMNYSLRVVGPAGNEIPPTEMGNQWLHPTRFYHQSVETITADRAFSQSVPLEKLFTMTNSGDYTIEISRDTYDKKVSAGPLKIRLAEP